MRIFAVIAGIAIVAGILLDAFETIVLPRRITRTFRLTSWFYRNTWVPWARGARRIKSPARREAVLGYFGPSSLILLLILWAFGLIFGFALLQYGAGEHLQLSNERVTFGALMYHSGETFFTLGYGDITPVSPVPRALAVLEAGMGFAFPGGVIGYLPTIYSAFSRRGIEISLLDVRAGSPPTAAEFLTRLRAALGDQDLRLKDGVEAEEKLDHLRSLYEPYAIALARRLFITLPPWIHPEKKKDNWQGGPWDRLIQARGLGRAQRMDEHF